MRRFLLASFFLSAVAAAAPPSSPSEYVLVMNVSVDVKGATARSVGGATMSREWLESWSNHASERREVTLQPLTADGQRGPATTYRGCSLSGVSGLQGNSNVVGSVRLSCQE